MPNEKTQTIEVKYDADARYWTMNPGDGIFHGPPYPTLEVPYNHKGVFTFKIVNTPGAEFGNPPFVPKKGKPNPGDFDSQFTSGVQSVHNKKKILVVNDANTNSGGQHLRKDYNYELNFQDGSTLDPIITNMGCCRAAYYDEVLWSMIGAGALALFLHGVRFWQERRALPVTDTAIRNSNKS